jgi:hypothetical protein
MFAVWGETILRLFQIEKAAKVVDLPTQTAAAGGR